MLIKADERRNKEEKEDQDNRMHKKATKEAYKQYRDLYLDIVKQLYRNNLVIRLLNDPVVSSNRTKSLKSSSDTGGHTMSRQKSVEALGSAKLVEGASTTRTDSNRKGQAHGLLVASSHRRRDLASAAKDNNSSNSD